MKVQEYRDLIDHVFDTLTSARSAATASENRTEWARLRRVLAELVAASCPRASANDIHRAASVERQAREFVESKKREFDAVDSAMIRMAYGKGY